MPAPLLLIAGGAISSMAFGYALDHTIGDGDYTAREAAVDGTLGALGVGSALKAANAARKGAKYHRTYRTAQRTGERQNVYSFFGTIERGINLSPRALQYARNVELQHFALQSGTLVLGHHLAGSRSGGSDASRPGDTAAPSVTSTALNDSGYHWINPIAKLLAMADEGSFSETRKKRARRRRRKPCRCKDGSYSIKCCK